MAAAALAERWAAAHAPAAAAAAAAPEPAAGGAPAEVRLGFATQRCRVS